MKPLTLYVIVRTRPNNPPTREFFRYRDQTWVDSLDTLCLVKSTAMIEALRKRAQSHCEENHRLSLWKLRLNLTSIESSVET